MAMNHRRRLRAPQRTHIKRKDITYEDQDPLAVARRCSSRASRWSRPVAAATTTSGDAARHRPTERRQPRPPSRSSRSTGAPSRRRSIPGLATDTTSSNILLNIMDPLVKLDDDLKPVPSRGRELRDERGRQDRHVHAARRPEVDERRPGHRAGLRVLVEAHGLARARRRLRVPVLRHRRARRSTTAAIRRRTTATRSPTRWASRQSTTRPSRSR